MSWQWIKELLSAWLTGLNSKVISKNSETGIETAPVSEPLPAPAPVPAIPEAKQLLGIDVSHHNGVLDWPKIAAAGVSFAFVKATESTGFVDGQLATNIMRAKSSGILVGAYHFLRPDASGELQAQHFLATLNKLTCDLPPVLDWEASGNLPRPQQVQCAKAWLAAVQLATGRVPIIYTGPSFFDELGSPKGFERYPLWIAHYGVNKPRIPVPWKTCAFWQFTETRKLPGVPGLFDLNRFIGTRAELKALT